jgi:hypothetical protein
MAMSTPRCLDKGLPVPFVSREKIAVVKAETIYNHTEGASMAQEVLVYSNVGCGPCQPAMGYPSQEGVLFIEKNVSR